MMMIVGKWIAFQCFCSVKDDNNKGKHDDTGSGHCFCSEWASEDQWRGALNRKPITTSAMLQINNNTGPPFCKLYLWQFNCQLIYKLLKIHVFRSPRTSWNKPLVRNSTEIDFVTQVTLIQNSVYDGRNALQKCMMAEMLFENDGSNTLNKYIIPTKSKKPRVKNTKSQKDNKFEGLYFIKIWV